MLSAGGLLKQPIAPLAAQNIALASVADASARAGAYAATNYGNLTFLRVLDDTSNSNDFQSYLRFDMSGVSGAVTSATLKLTPVALGSDAASAAFRVRLLPDAVDGWIEGNGGSDNQPLNELTWNNRPAGSGTALAIAGSQLRVGQATSIDVTSLLNQSSNANKLVSFQIDSTSTASARRGVDFGSREHAAVAYRPTLVVTVSSGGDDAPQTASPLSPVIPLDASGKGSRAGTLETVGDRDAFRIDIASVGVYQFDQIAVTQSDPFLRLLDANGNLLASNDDLSPTNFNSRIVYPVKPGAYYLVAGAYIDAGTGTYTLSISKQSSNAAPTVATPAAAAPSPVTATTANLSVLGGDDGGEPNLKYTWSATTLPTGALTPTFSTNGAGAAKNTTATFFQAGTYGFLVTIVDQGGLSTTSTVNVLVNQTLTSVVVTPDSVSLATGATQQFAAAGKDQFGKNMVSAPSFTWSATAGTITAGGFYTAPGAAVNAVVTATGGGRLGTASIAVGSMGINDPELANLVQTLFADGSLGRNDMIQVLRKAGNDDGVVNATELKDLKGILNKAATFHIPGYVQVLAGDVVNGSPANAKYLGQSLGNLYAGSSSTQMDKLVNKWFLGADHPADSHAYQSFAGSLFVGNPTYTDLNQGGLGDCYFIASLGAVAKSSVAAIQNVFIDNGDNTWTVRLYAGSQADYVTVDRYLPTNGFSAVYAGVGGGSYTNSGNELWIALAEKAYAQWNETGKEGRSPAENTYTSLDGGWTQNACSQLLGNTATVSWWLPGSDKQLLINGVNANKAVTYATNGNPGDGLYGPHAYVVTGYNSVSDTFQLFNPWGGSHPGPLSYAQLRTNGQCFVISDASGTTPPSGSPLSPFRPVIALIAASISGPISLPAGESTSASFAASGDSAQFTPGPVASVAWSTNWTAQEPMWIHARSAGVEARATDHYFDELAADGNWSGLAHSLPVLKSPLGRLRS